MGTYTAAKAETIDWFDRHRHGLPQDRARFLFHRAAMAGSPQAQLAIGVTLSSTAGSAINASAVWLASIASHQERSPGIDLVMPLHLRRPPIPTELSIEVAIAKEGRLTSPIARKNQENWIKSVDALQEKYAIRKPKR